MSRATSPGTIDRECGGYNPGQSQEDTHGVSTRLVDFQGENDLTISKKSLEKSATTRSDSPQDYERNADKDGDEGAPGRKKRLLITAFLTLLCYISVIMAMGSTLSQYVYQRTARGYSNTTNDTKATASCSRQPADENDTMAATRNKIQADSAQFSLYLDYTTYIPALFLCLLLGSYSDYLGRRILVLLSVSGCFLKALMFLLVVCLELPLNFLFLGWLADGLFGAVYGLQLGLLAATADVTVTTKERALTFALLEGALAIAGAVSQIAVGFLITSVGFVGPAVLCFTLISIAFIIVVFFMPETLRRPRHIVFSPLVHLRKVFGFYFLEGSSLQKGLFWCALFVSVFLTFCQMGSMMVETLYVLNAPFCWDSVKIGVFGGLRQFVTVSAGIVILKVLQQYMGHATIGLVAMFSGAASFTLEGFASADWMMYMVPVLGLAFMCALPIVKVLVSKMTPADRQGAIFSSVAAVETICHLTSTTMYNTLYTSTLDTFPGAVFLLMASFCVISMILLTTASKGLHFEPPAEIGHHADETNHDIENVPEEKRPLLDNERTQGIVT